MAELHPAPFADLVERIHVEYAARQAIFDLPSRQWYVPKAGGPDLSVRLHGRLAANPIGPAAGPHTQMAQNLVLAWLAGARILELKTIQLNDHLRIPRPCIAAPNVGYNVEWSQELPLEQSLTQYVAGAMLIHMIRRGRFFGDVDLSGDLGATILDLSVGYDLAGIQSARVRKFIRRMENAKPVIDRLRGQIPARHAHLRDLDYPRRLVTCATLSTFHGCPPDEIERMCRFLLVEQDLDVVIKMNPPMLGRERLEYLLHDVLGYHEMKVNPRAYETGLRLDEGLAMCRRLATLAERHGRSVGAKFSNTLEVLNPGRALPGEIVYLSGPPLFPIAMTLADEFRRRIGPDFPISFSAGIDRRNVAHAVACGFCPVTACTDLLKTGGYARLPAYLDALTAEMDAAVAATIDDYICRARAMADRARELAGADAPASPTQLARITAMLNTTVIAEEARNDPRYRAEQNRAGPRRVDSQLELFDCLTCEKCVPVCPNDANFVFEVEARTFAYRDVLVARDGSTRPDDEERTFRVEEAEQIANYADFCNECGNCDTFCPERGGPFVRKPRFFGSIDSWQRHTDGNGFFATRAGTTDGILARLNGRRYRLEHDHEQGVFRFDDDAVELTLRAPGHHVEQAAWLREPPLDGCRVDMGAFHTLRVLLAGILAGGRVHPVNIRYLGDAEPPAPPAGHKRNP